MKSLTQLILIALGALTLTSCNDQSKTEIAQKPNILFIAVDDLRPEMNSYGATHIQSPSTDELASESIVFERTYCNVPVCGASRASLLSGVRPGWHRFINYYTRLDRDYPGVTSLPRHFKNNGYTTISNGKIYHHSNDDSSAWNEIWNPRSDYSWRDYQLKENIELQKGEDTNGPPFENIDVPDNTYKDGKIAEKAVADLKKLKDADEPFFLAVGFLKPHLPFNAPSNYWKLYDRNDITLPENYKQPETTPERAFHNFGELRAYHNIPKEGPVSDSMALKLIHGYYACVSYTDAQIGKVLKAVEDLELDDNTIVILWGDHGWNLGDHKLWCKHCNFESSLHTPMLLKVPGKTSGQRTDAIVEFIDIYPTLCELAGLSVPEHTDGESMVPLLNGGQRDKNFAISKYHDGVTLVEGTLFYTEWLNDQKEIVTRMLFDHETDPLELNNLAEKPEYADKVEELSKKLHANWGDDFYVNRRLKK